jgi:hypothetical protein
MGRHARAGMAESSKTAQHDIMRGQSNRQGWPLVIPGERIIAGVAPHRPWLATIMARGRMEGAWSMEHDDGQDESRSAAEH